MKTITRQFETYKKAVEYLDSSYVQTIDLGLDRISRLLNLIDNPQDSLNCIHVAGTNGKGSVIKFIESILIEAGYNVGTFTSPHLVEYTERIAINGKPISENLFLDYYNKVFKLLNHYKDSGLTLFEFITAMGFMYFADQDVDVVLLETGLGGRFDATNVIKKPLMSIITRIDIDHTAYLGNTIDQIAYEKAGIIKNNTYVLLCEDNPGKKTIINVAKEKNATVIIAEPERYSFVYKEKALKQLLYFESGERIAELSMIGEHHRENIAIVLEAIRLMNHNGYNISHSAVKTGLKNALWPGRAQFFHDENILIDGAHNPCGAKTLRDLLDIYFKDKKIIWITGILKTKDADAMLDILFREGDRVITTEPASNSAIPAYELAEKALNTGKNLDVTAACSLQEALEMARNALNNNSIIVLTGSLYLAGSYLSLRDECCRGFMS